MIQHFHFRDVSSTNDYAKELLDQHDRVIVTAESQFKGRGRKGRAWLGEISENVYFSFGMNHHEEPSPELCSLFQGLGCNIVLKSLQSLTKLNIFKLKYPNDVLALYRDNYRKVSGILVEHSFLGSQCDKSIVGIGINVYQTSFPDEIRQKAVSLKMLNADLDKNEVIAELTKQFEFAEIDENRIFEEWNSNLDIIGKEIVLAPDGIRCLVERMLPDGRLAVKNLTSGDSMIISDGESIQYKLKDF